MKINISIVKYLPNLIYFFIITFLLADSYGYNETVYKYFGMQSYSIAVLLFSALVFLRFKYGLSLAGSFKSINSRLIFLPFLVISIFLIFLDYFYFPNFVFSLTKLQYTHMYFIALFSGLVMLLCQSDSWFKKHYKKTIFLGAPIAFISAFIMVIFPFDKFIELSREDQLIEMAQNLILLGMIIFSIKILLQFHKKRKWPHKLIFIVITAVLIFLAGEEISWGQRVLSVETPTVFYEKTYNTKFHFTIFTTLIVI